MTLDSISESGKHVLDAAAVLTVVGTLADLLPPIAALFTVLWCSMQMYGFVEARIEKRRSERK